MQRQCTVRGSVSQTTEARGGRPCGSQTSLKTRRLWETAAAAAPSPNTSRGNGPGRREKPRLFQAVIQELNLNRWITLSRTYITSRSAVLRVVKKHVETKSHHHHLHHIPTETWRYFTALIAILLSRSNRNVTANDRPIHHRLTSARSLPRSAVYGPWEHPLRVPRLRPPGASGRRGRHATTTRLSIRDGNALLRDERRV